MENPISSFSRTETLWRVNDHRSLFRSSILDVLIHGPVQFLLWQNFVFRGALWVMFVGHRGGGNFKSPVGSFAL